MTRIRASTQINDDDHLLLTDADKATLLAAIESNPTTGQYEVAEIYRNADGQIVVVYDATTES